MGDVLDQRLRELYENADQFNEEIPYQLSLKIEMYAKILGVLGDKLAQSTYKYGKAYSDRKASYGHWLVNVEGTGVEKTGEAELRVYKLRLKEVQEESELNKWKYTYESTIELIQAMKKTLEILKAEYDGKINR